LIGKELYSHIKVVR